MLGKWLWRFGKEDNAFWRQVILAKYGSYQGGWTTRDTPGPYGVSVWKYIRKAWENFSRNLYFEVGDGTRIKFWLDIWCGHCRLRDIYLELFRIAENKEAFVGDHLRYRNEVVAWDLKFNRPVKDWELESVSSFLEMLYSSSVKGYGLDMICWRGSSLKGFQVKSYYRVLSTNIGHCVPWKSI